MKKLFVSWNVNGIRAVEKKGALKDIWEMSPEIFAVQETKCLKSQLPEGAFAPSPYVSYFDEAKDRKGYAGVALYCKTVPKKVDYGLGIDEFDREGRMLTAHFEDFAFVTSYFPNGGRDADHFKFKLAYYEKFHAHVNKLRKKYKTVIACGDFNVAHNEIDLARPKENEKQIGFLPIERGFLDRFNADGWVDTFRCLHNDEIKYSWWDQKTRSRDRNVGWRIDYMFINKESKDTVKKANILTEVFGSDHAPTVLEVEV